MRAIDDRHHGEMSHGHGNVILRLVKCNSTFDYQYDKSLIAEYRTDINNLYNISYTTDST